MTLKRLNLKRALLERPSAQTGESFAPGAGAGPGPRSNAGGRITLTGAGFNRALSSQGFKTCLWSGTRFLRVSSAEGKISLAEGEISLAQGKISLAEGNV